MYKHGIKRFLDLTIALLGLPFLGVIYIFVAPLIYLSDKGPIFYNAPRLGKNGKVFQMYKFRSMRVNAPDVRNSDGSTFNGDKDPRVTTIGRIIRKTSIDETPQLLNILKGDMSLVGPRAFLASSLDDYEKFDYGRKKRLTVRPGITGYSQAYYRNSIGTEEKIENDCYYVDNVSFTLDLKIFLKTILSVLKHENIYVTTDKKE